MKITHEHSHHTTLPLHSTFSPAKTWIEIDKAAFEHNIAHYKNIVAPALFAPVIKSNAYGHGIEIIAQLCDKNPAVDRLCVVSLREALHLRSLGIKKQIIVLSIIDDQLAYAALHEIIIPIYDIDTAYACNEVGKKYGKKITVHIKIDTGLSRLGFAHNAHAYIKEIAQLSYIFIEGIFTHFANSESADPHFVHYQTKQFNQILQQLHREGITIPMAHTSCSAAITAYKETHYTLARAGIGIYGLSPSAANKKITAELHPTFTPKPILQWKTTIIQIKTVPEGSYVGYDLTHRTSRPATIATLPVGYWDGYDRQLSNNSHVILHGRSAPVIGRVAMNLMMVDVTDIPCNVGDEVVLLGNYPGITADDLAQRCTTINYEFVTRINPLLPRRIV